MSQNTLTKIFAKTFADWYLQQKIQHVTKLYVSYSQWIKWQMGIEGDETEIRPAPKFHLN